LVARGPLADHARARAFAEEVHRVHKRYAAEVVAANRLCPFLRDVETGFGAFVAMLDPGEPGVEAVEATVEAVLAVKNPVIHVVFPLARIEATPFERFSARLAEALKRAMPNPPVMATFHPALVGDRTNAHKLVGVLRRAPDPFVQLIPEGMHEGGTVFAPLADAAAIAAAQTVDTSTANFAKLQGPKMDELLAKLAEIHADRAASYAPFLEAFGLG